MNYEARVTKRAKKDIKKLNQIVKKRIKKKILLFSQAPLKYSKKLFGIAKGSYRWRIGNYRVIFDLQGKNIIILRIGHRREIYQ
jgi:mRNA interferase RelE/StbE